jgi:hypothetical protein
VWIAQEIGTGAPAKVFWGHATMDWQTLYHVFDILMKDHKPLRARLDLRVGNVTYLHNRFNLTRTVRPPVDGVSFTSSIELGLVKRPTLEIMVLLCWVTFQLQQRLPECVF